jgi:YHS domain
MATRITRTTLATVVASSLALLVLPALGNADAGTPRSVPLALDDQNVAPDLTGLPRLAIGGYDTVAYHTMGKAVPGRLEYQTIWHDARWQFSSKENLDLFTQDPEKYAAQYDGHCAMGVAYENGHKDTVDPEAFTIVNGKLYLNHTKYWATEWRKNAAQNISRADNNWPTVKKMPEPDK